ncbi:MAG: AAA family ATPase [Bdellovibrionaceae bacterium]|nr:AAA family ATPase [Pseudobdellovibrionaceae bacterium]
MENTTSENSKPIKQDPSGEAKADAAAHHQQVTSENSAHKNENPSEIPAENPASLPNPAEIQKEFQELIRKKFGNAVQVVTVDAMNSQMAEEVVASQQEKPKKDFRFSYTPKQLVDELNTAIIGQEDAKRSLALAVCDHYRHIHAEQMGDVADNYQKQNVLLLGPTGVGKTFLVRSIAKMIGVPFVKADATRFTEVGFVGANVDDVIRDLVQQAKGDISLAENGIVYIDEVDKIAGSSNQTGRDVNGRGVQFGLLRLLEDAEVDLNSSHDMQSQFKMFMNLQKKGEATKEVVKTKNILFIFSGAFHDIVPIIRKRMTNSKLGIHSEVKTKTEEDQFQFLQHVHATDLVEFGFEQEFIGRLPVVTGFHQLSVKQLFEILKFSKASIIHQHVRSFKHYGIDLSFNDAALNAIAEKAYTLKTGARSLAHVCASLLKDFKYEMPERHLTKLEVTPELIQNPKGYLQYLLGH